MIPNSANLSLTNSNESSQHAQTNNEHANGKIAKCKLDKADQSCELQQECNGSIDKQDSANKDNEVSFADKRIKDEFKKEKHAAKQLAEQLKLLQVNDNKPSEWKFWSTQPVVMNPVEKVFNEPIQSNVDETKIRKDPICLPEGFSWSVINVDDNKELLEVYFLLNENYVQDDDNMFRFDYSKDFLKWALCSPGWLSDWHVGIRATKSKKLLGFISGVPATIQIRGKIVKSMEINFFCVHKQLRSKRMGPVLIKEITRRANLKSIFQAVYTSGTVLPGMIGKCRYWHRSLNVKKLVDINFSYLSPLVTLQRSIRLHRLPEKTQTKGFRAMRDEDIPQAHKLLAEHLKRFAISPVFTLDEFKHHFISRPEIVSSFVVAEPNGKISDFSSFYHLSSSVLQHPNYNKLNAAYSFYTVAKQTPLVDLMRDLLITAKEMGFDVFNALDSMDNRTFLEELKFGMGDGDLHYYLYNWQTGFMQSNEIGLTLL